MNGSAARDIVESAIRRELYGPSGNDLFQGVGVDCSGAWIRIPKAQVEATKYHDAVTGEELLTHMDPLRRYGIGVLHGGGRASGQRRVDDEASSDIDTSWVSGLGETAETPFSSQVEFSGSAHGDTADDDDFDLSDANTLKPSSMAITFRARTSQGGAFRLRARGASYQAFKVGDESAKEKEWWLRRPFSIEAEVSASRLGRSRRDLQIVKAVPVLPDGQEDHSFHAVLPELQVFSREDPKEPGSDLRLITVAMVNTAPGTGNKHALFQCGFEVFIEGGLAFESYPVTQLAERDHEEREINLLYRKKQTFAIGHGCAARWSGQPGAVAVVATDALPAHEVASLTPNVYLKNKDGSFEIDEQGNRVTVTVSMEALASGSREGKEQVELVLSLYSEWILERRNEIADLGSNFHVAAERQMRLCSEMLDRMRQGWRLVQTNPLAARAFALANEAMLYQQIRSRLPDRKLVITDSGPVFDVPLPDVKVQPGQGRWRPFQIAFVLASLPELIDPCLPKRELVDLIFFPTGGGKTEAYLGAAAVSLIARRLRNPADGGTDTLMRYTLRLLTAQQFLRAAALICVLEDIRSRFPNELGESSFGIGIWLGGSSTPNTWGQAVRSLKAMLKDPKEKNVFLLARCPWCGAKMGRIGEGNRRKKGNVPIAGYFEQAGRVVLRCPDAKCRFGSRRTQLPVHVVDEDIYQSRPSLVIGTVDKFAMTAWNPTATAIFGLDAQGNRVVSPPNLIIQDELHLISGPLGSMVGLYEPVIEELCTDRRCGQPVGPKIIASTATIRRYEDQVLGLYGRTDVAVFPPQGLEEGRSFFAEPETLPNGDPAPGRRYLGVMSSSLGSMQTVQVRVAAATLMGAVSIPAGPARDGYWTNLNFLNSLRELGNTKYLLDSDVPDYLIGLRRRDGLKDPRWPKKVLELTSRRRSDEIPEAIDALERSYGDPDCIDICLASNIIEVGVDINRLALMTVVGQPKTTAQYIQVSGRVGRKPEVAPGLVVTIYGAAKPRDRSHYERFKTYHQQLYAQVEPTSVTPFASPVLRRALHAAVIAYIRQSSPQTMPFPFPAEGYQAAVQLLRERVERVNADELEVFDELATHRRREWEAWQRTEWSANAFGGNPLQGLMRFAGTLPDLDSRSTTWDVPTSMRNVDAECAIDISTAYALEDGSIAEELA